MDSASGDLDNLTFDEWDKNFIASFEENIFNLIDDDGKNVGFMLSPKAKGERLFLSPDGKRLSPHSFRKTFSTPPQHLKFTPISGAELQGFNDSSFSALSSSSVAQDKTTNRQVASAAQPKKQLFPCDTRKDAVVGPCFVGHENEAQESFLSGPLPSKGRLQAARLRFKLTLQKAVQNTAERMQGIQRLSGESDVVVKHPELRHALGTYGGHNLINSETTMFTSQICGGQRCMVPASRKPYCKENCKRVSKYSRIQPKPTQPQYFALCPLKK